MAMASDTDDNEFIVDNEIDEGKTESNLALMSLSFVWLCRCSVAQSRTAEETGSFHRD